MTTATNTTIKTASRIRSTIAALVKRTPRELAHGYTLCVNNRAVGYYPTAETAEAARAALPVSCAAYVADADCIPLAL